MEEYNFVRTGVIQLDPVLKHARAAMFSELTGAHNFLLYNAFNSLNSDQLYLPLEDWTLEKITQIRSKQQPYPAQLWAGIRPGDYRYCMHQSDRKKAVRNVKKLISHGVDKIFILADQTHPGTKVCAKDGNAHAALISDISQATGGLVAGILGEEYTGYKIKHQQYIDAVVGALPEGACVAWMGPKAWNATVQPQDFPKIHAPLMLWDNYLTHKTTFNWLASIRPYTGRSADLAKTVHTIGFTLNPNLYQDFVPLATAREYARLPDSYNPENAQRKAVNDMAQRLWVATHGEAYDPMVDGQY